MPETGSEDKSQALSKLMKRASGVAELSCNPGSRTVWGEGNPNAIVAFIGEAPGDRETRLGRPFVGAAGQLFDKELERAGIDRGGIWISNAVKCRPVETRTTGRLANRPPTAAEVSAWLPFLLEELKIVNPRLVICLGAVAAKALIRKDFAITKERGQWFDGPLNKQIMATFHPSYILRVLAANGEKQVRGFRQDLEEVKRRAETTAD